MTSDFKEAVNITLKDEGGLSNDKQDPGGITKYGISFRFLKDNGIDINKDGLINDKDIQNLTIDEAVSIYKSEFWQKYNIGLINNQKIADKAFDLSVNMGGSQAIKLLQEAINSFLNSIRLKPDGVIGFATIAAIKSLDSAFLLIEYKKLASDFYKELAQRNPKLHIFLKGWLERANQ